MSVADWVHAEWLPWLAALLVTTAVAVNLARLRARRRRRRLGPRLRPGLSVTRDALLLVALAAIGVALAGPRLGERLERVPASGVDVVMLVDVSRSMDAPDVAPSRIARARQALEELLARLGPGDRVALAFFGSRGVLASPLTPDRDAIAQLARALDTRLLQPAGSHLGAGVRAALEAFDAGSDRPRAVFVLSDGEDPNRRSDLGISDALRAEAKVFAAAFGSDAGSTVPDHGLPLRDADGAVVVSRRQAERLERLTRATGGALYRTDVWGVFDYDAAAGALRRAGLADAAGMTTPRVRAVQVWPCAALAFALLVLEGLPRPRRGASARLAGIAALAATLVGAGGGDPAHLAARQHAGARDPAHLAAALHIRPGDPRLLIELGLDRLDRGRREAAMRAFRAAAVGAQDRELAALAWYDLGVAALEASWLEEARAAFFDALALAPDDRQARFNLEWTQLALQLKPPEPPPPSRTPPRESEKQQKLEPEEGSESESSAELSPEQRRRWLERVNDDLGRALEAAARAARPRRRTAGPAW